MIKLIFNLFSTLLDRIILLRYKKKFKNYQAAKEFCEKHTKSSYNNEILNKFRFDKFTNNKELIPYTFNNGLFTLLESVSLYIFNHNKIPKILDFGGMFAENKFYLEELYKLKFVYDVVETKSICELAKNLNHANFFSEINNAYLNSANQYDLIFSSGTIQYFEKPYDIISEIFSKKTPYVVFTRTNFSDDENIYSAASFLFGHGSSEGHIKYITNNHKKLILVPNTQIKETKMLNIAKDYNYKPVRVFNGLTGHHGNNSYTKDLIFKN